MALTRVVFELTSKERRHDLPFLMALHTSLEANCKHLDCVIAPRREYVEVPGIDRNLQLASSNAFIEMMKDSSCTRCLYIAPRSIAVPLREDQLRIRGAVLAVRNRERLTGAYVLKVKSPTTPQAVLTYLDSQIAAAVGSVVPPDTSAAERDEAQQLFNAVVKGYQLAIEMLSIKAGTRRLDS